jgi:hypothetical protein
MIYIDFFIRATQERHFYKFEGDSFEITELHIGKNNYEWTGRERDETHSIPIRFTLKTNLGEYHNFDIDCGYTEGKDYNKLNYRHYKMSYFCIMDEKDGLFIVSEEWDEANHKWNTDCNYHEKIMQYFNNKIKTDTDYLKKRFQELKKLDNMQTDFAV